MTASLGIDVGLSGVRASVMRDDGRVLATARCVSSPTFAEGLAEQDPRGWLAGAIEAGSRAVAEAATIVDGVAVVALGPVPVPTPDEPDAVAGVLVPSAAETFGLRT